MKNYPPDYNDIKHTIDDPIEEIDEVAEFDDSDEFRDEFNIPVGLPDGEDEIPAFDEM